MKKKQKSGRETRQKMAFSAVLGIALLFLGGVLAVNFWQHLSGSDVFATVISGLGTLLVLAVGIILLGWGVVQVGLSFQSHDPSQRSQGFLTLAGGVVITFAKEILDLITGA